MVITMTTQELKALLIDRKHFKFCYVRDAGDNTDDKGIWHVDVRFDDDRDAVCSDKAEHKYQFNSIYNDGRKWEK